MSSTPAPLTPAAARARRRAAPSSARWRAVVPGRDLIETRRRRGHPFITLAASKHSSSSSSDAFSSARDARSSTSGGPTPADAELEALAARRDAAKAAAEAAQKAYVRALAASVSPSADSKSMDEATERFNASPFADCACEYGFIQSNAGLYIDLSKNRPPGVPKNVLAIATENFAREFAALRAATRGAFYTLVPIRPRRHGERDSLRTLPGASLHPHLAFNPRPRCLSTPTDAFQLHPDATRGDENAPGNGGPVILIPSEAWRGTETQAEIASELRDQLATLTLSNAAIWERERSRTEVPAPWIIKAPYFALCTFLDLVFPEDRPIQRFWFLESVARMPYFSYNTMLTLYELLGWWRRSSELRRVHFAEEWNEYHHLLIMESLGGDALWRDRFLAQHAALAYYLVLIALWLISPALAYNFSELIEAHAVDTYAQFADENKEKLRTLPAPRIARAYYENDDMYLFDEFQTARPRSSRRPRVRTLHDTFCAIRDDENEHVATMKECQMEDSAMADVNKVNVGTAVALLFIAVNAWASRVAQTAGIDALEMDGVDAGEMFGEEGLFAGILRLFSFLPFL